MIDHKFVDVDLEQESEYCGGMLVPLEADRETLDFEKVYPLIPRSEWKETAERLNTALRNCVREVKNQGREGSCVGNGILGAYQARLFLAGGIKNYTKMSAMSLYKRIGRSPGSGAYVPDGINEMLENGALPLDTFENTAFNHVHPATGFSTSLPGGWKETARLFRVRRWLKTSNTDEWFSALGRGMPIVYGRKQHCIFSLIPQFEGSKLFYGYINSWGSWGDTINNSVGKGLGWDSESLVNSCVGYACDLITYPER